MSEGLARATLLLQATGLPTTSYGVSLAQSLFATLGVAALAWALLRMRKGAGTGRGLIEILDSQVLDRGSYEGGRISVVAIDGRRFVIGSAPRSTPRLIAELDAPTPTEPVATFRETLAKDEAS